MEVVITTGVIRCAKLQSNCHHQQTNAQLFTGGCPSCHPKNSVRGLRKKYDIPLTCSSQVNLEYLLLVFDHFCPLMPVARKEKPDNLNAAMACQEHPGCSHLSYPDRLVRLNLDSLVVRRLRHDLILTYKIVFGLTDVNPEDFFTFARDVRKTPKFGSYSVFKNRTVTEPSKNLTSVQTVFRQKLRANSQFMLKVTKSYFTSFKCAHKERFKRYRNRN